MRGESLIDLCGLLLDNTNFVLWSLLGNCAIKAKKWMAVDHVMEVIAISGFNSYFSAVSFCKQV